MKKDNRSYYDEFATWYEKERHDGYHAMIDDLEVDLIMPWARDADVLEVGCGTGLILRRVEPFARRATGIDISPGMLEVARERGLEVLEGNATELPFEDESFDLVYSFKVLAHVKDIDLAFDEMLRVTRPGGRLVLEFYNKLSLRYFAKRLAGPGAISNKTDEGAVYTRWDDPGTLQERFGSRLDNPTFSGVRVFTPAAFVHRVPALGSVLRSLEWKARDSPLRKVGGFLVLSGHRPG